MRVRGKKSLNGSASTFRLPPPVHGGNSCRDKARPHLVKFSGRPGKPTPKSYLLYVTGRTPKAFDHHEWYVSCGEGSGTRRYVLDYYSVDELTFSVDVRPAIDDFASLKARTKFLADKMRERIKGKGNDD
jgi:Cytochrome c/c1 heme lyase